jgi:hypothetical protein
MWKTTGLVIAVLFAAAISVSAQDTKPQHSPFGCSDGAVSVELDKHPPLRFKLLEAEDERPPSYVEGHKFIFTGEGPFLHVTVFLTATIPEAGVGTSSTARLSVYVQTAETADEYHSGRNTQWWRLESVPGSEIDRRNSSATLTFEASRIAGCFGGGGASDCSFADVAPSTPDKAVPLISVGFTENLGGANAANWTESRLLLDFRSSPPTVAITADCGYNEGGGACTTYDSQQMERTNLQCDWKGEARDFLCSEESTPGTGGHSDFYLLGDADAPLRADEVGSLSDAVVKFASVGHAAPVKVRGMGPVSWIDELKLEASKSVTILGSSGRFYFVRKHRENVAPEVTVSPHWLLAEDPLPSEIQHKRDTPRPNWTADIPVTFASRTVFRDRRLAVFQAIEKYAQGPTGLYWIGIEYSSPTPAFDVLQLAGGGKYAGCARYDLQATALSVGRLSRAHEAALRVQPATTESETDFPLVWRGERNEQEASNCVRPGKIWWRDQKFHASADSGDCPTPEKPRYVKINDDGSITLTDSAQPE